jgi:hypothetical protein
MDTKTAPSTLFPINYLVIVIRNLETEHSERVFEETEYNDDTTGTHKKLNPLVASRKEYIVWLSAND